MLRILDLFAGIGGTARGFQKCLNEVGVRYEYYAVDIDEAILVIHKRLNPKSITIQRDAYTFSKETLRTYDFIWASPPCHTHSRGLWFRKRYLNVEPDYRLYDLIRLLRSVGKPFIVENVIPRYEPPIKYDIVIGRHVFWTNLYLRKVPFRRVQKDWGYMKISDWLEFHDLPKDLFDGVRVKNKLKVLRNTMDYVLAYNIACLVIPQVVLNQKV